MDLNREVAENVMGWKLIANRFMNENKKAGYFLPSNTQPYMKSDALDIGT